MHVVNAVNCGGCVVIAVIVVIVVTVVLCGSVCPRTHLWTHSLIYILVFVPEFCTLSFCAHQHSIAVFAVNVVIVENVAIAVMACSDSSDCSYFKYW